MGRRRKRLDDAVTGLARAPVGCTTRSTSPDRRVPHLHRDRGRRSRVCAVTVTRPVATATRATHRPRWRCRCGPRRRRRRPPDSTAAPTTTRPGSSGNRAVVVDHDDRRSRPDRRNRGRRESADRSFAIAVGKDPNSGVAMLRIGAVIAALTGLIVGVACIVLGSRRRPDAAASQTPAWPAATGWPSAPPGSPPGGAGGTEPPVGPPQGWSTNRRTSTTVPAACDATTCTAASDRAGSSGRVVRTAWRLPRGLRAGPVGDTAGRMPGSMRLASRPATGPPATVSARRGRRLAMIDRSGSVPPHHGDDPAVDLELVGAEPHRLHASGWPGSA